LCISNYKTGQESLSISLSSCPLACPVVHSVVQVLYPSSTIQTMSAYHYMTLSYYLELSRMSLDHPTGVQGLSPEL